MELDPKTISRVWWKGALSSAAKGIPQGLMLGAIAAFVLFGVIAGTMLIAPAAPLAITTAQAFGGFLYSHSVATALATQGLTMATASSLITSIASISLVPIMLFNAVLTSVGNFLTGGDIAVNAYKQQVDHDANVARIDQLESQQMMSTTPVRSATVQKILANGPRSNAQYKSDAELPAGTTVQDTITRDIPGGKQVDTFTHVVPPRDASFAQAETGRTAAAVAPSSPTIH